MNYIFCDKKCYEELKEIDTLLDTKCSDISKAIAKLKEKRNSSGISEFANLVITIVLTTATVCAVLHFNIHPLLKYVMAIVTVIISGPFWSLMIGLIDMEINEIRANWNPKLKAIDQALENLREFKEEFKQIRDKIRLSELFEIEQLSHYIRECKNSYAQVFLNVAEYDRETVRVAVTAKAETKRSKDGTAEFHTLGQEKVFTIAKDFCAKIFPDPDTCDFSWLNNTSKQCLCSLERISEKIDGFKDVDPARMLEMKLDNLDIC
ncbi:MAG: hypothetical protein IKO10_03155 [Lachnospiraceae bacterium]|nr:hypothetical protein [Lachnospiraceae bacterium]